MYSPHKHYKSKCTIMSWCKYMYILKQDQMEKMWWWLKLVEKSFCNFLINWTSKSGGSSQNGQLTKTETTTPISHYTTCTFHILKHMCTYQLMPYIVQIHTHKCSRGCWQESRKLKPNGALSTKAQNFNHKISTTSIHVSDTVVEKESTLFFGLLSQFISFREPQPVTTLARGGEVACQRTRFHTRSHIYLSSLSTHTKTYTHFPRLLSSPYCSHLNL